MLKKLQAVWQSHTLTVILLLAAVFRLIAAIFSKGYGMSDDHFLVIEIAQNWVDKGLGQWFDRDEPHGHSMVYPFLHYLLFLLLKGFNITDPQTKMLIVRMIHAVYSLFIVWFGYRITLELSNEKTARQVALMLALFWILPIMSVRNLIEHVCIPPLLAGFYLALIADSKSKTSYWIFSGLMFGLAFIFRYQVSIMIVGVGIVLIGKKKWREMITLSTGMIMGIIGIQGIFDWIAWGYPFAALKYYIINNIQGRLSYTSGPWYRYTLLILGVFIPPTSLLLAWGFIRSWKKYSLLWVPAVLFLLFHSYFPNKQERFILPLLPIFLILGMIGWKEYFKNSKFWQNRKKLHNILWIWFWIANCFLLIIVTPNYTKKNRVESLYALSKKDDVSAVIWESYHDITPIIPRYYLVHDVPVYTYPKSKSLPSLNEEIEQTGSNPNYIIFLGGKNIEGRIKSFKLNFGVELKFLKKVNPSLIDYILFRANPKHNVNEVSYIYKIIPNTNN
jgi:4-amino-4-deoxy-L-arabinose transferase-like glycosyltransferase